MCLFTVLHPQTHVVELLSEINLGYCLSSVMGFFLSVMRCRVPFPVIKFVLKSHRISLSQTVPEKCGFLREGLFRKYLSLKGKTKRVFIYCVRSADPCCGVVVELGECSRKSILYLA
eukprot:TRINITY_DN35084_c0_g1_i2.p1 TRINITY_DN35084_c0_g1~~TRINITY_DN35084_c0_g1_i2.p1  ORF type:complete len:117 (-),score=12.21 TRINITY_DN35084_c0_g1_i2:448-798(-)